MDPLDELNVVEPPGWPKAVGIISICWGIFWILCGVCGTGWRFFGASLMPPEVAKDLPPMVPGIGELALLVVGIGMDVVLIVAGFATVARKPTGRTLHLVYAGVAMIMLVAGVFVQMKVQGDMKQWAIDHPDSKFAQAMNGPGGGYQQMFGWAFFACLAGAYPVFCLIWFGLAGKRPEQGFSQTQVV